MIGDCSERRYAIPLVVASIALGIGSFAISHAYLQIGDLDAGAPELRPDSRYNRDVAYINAITIASRVTSSRSSR
jgi:hypothetical protein